MWCVVVGAAPVEPRPGLAARLVGATRVVAADGGAASALALGLTPDLVIGDDDSTDAATASALATRQVTREVWPTDKEATDGDLAMQRALAWGATRITFVGALGGSRHDHGLANVMLLAHPRLAGVTVSLLDNTQEVRLLRAGEIWRWRATPGEVVSLVPLGGRAAGVRTSGLRWPLHADTLDLGTTRGVSNEAVTSEVAVSLRAGLLIVTRLLPAEMEDWPLDSA
jgi:thiamine pyrophosphokinase